jgi:outer membrane protein assembly factor BamD
MFFLSSPHVCADKNVGRRSRLARFTPLTFITLMALCTLAMLVSAPVFAQTQQKGVSEISNTQRLNVMRSKIETMRKSLESAMAGMPAKDPNDKSKANPDDPRERLRGLNKEVISVRGEIDDLVSKQDKSEKYDVSQLDTLETTVGELNTRVQNALQETASARTAQSTTASNYHSKAEKKKRGMIGSLNPFHKGNNEKQYADLTSGAAPGRDKVLFESGALEVRKGNHEVGRLLFTTIITTYPDSSYLPLAKLAIADSFYLEGGTSNLIQAAQAYQDWLTFFPTDPLADNAMLKVAEAEMRQMGLSDRDISHARKAEQRLKALLQQFPQTKLRGTVESRLRDTQNILAMHDLQVGDFYLAHYKLKKGGLKGAQNRYQEIIDKYPGTCFEDKALYELAFTYQEEEEPDEAAKYYQRIVRDHPNSEYAEKAKEQLNVIGAAIPETNPNKKDELPCEKLSFMQNLMQQVSGSPNVSVDHDGILITHDGAGKDLIDVAIQNNGELPAGVEPVIQRTPPARVPVTPSPQPDAANDKKKPMITIQSTPTGPQPDRLNPAVSATPVTPTGTVQPEKKPQPSPTPTP